MARTLKMLFVEKGGCDGCFLWWKGLKTEVKSVFISKLHTITCFRGSVFKYSVKV